MSMANPYDAPSSDVNAREGDDRSSIEAAIAGRYDFEIEDVLREAWRLTKGFKLTCWGTLIIVGLATGIASNILGIPLKRMGMGGLVVLQIASIAMGFLVSLCLTMLAVRRAAELPATIGQAFSSLDRWATALVAGSLVMLLTMVGMVLLILPGIYLAVAYQMSMPLIGDRRLGAWEAMEISRQAVTKKWWLIFGTGVVAGILFILSAILVVPLFWTVPWLLLVPGVLYRRIFGVATTT